MALEITVPRLGWSMEEAVFREWLVEEGSPVKPGQALFILESDKAAQEIESLDGGILAIPEGAPGPGDTVVVGQLLGFLLAEGEAVPEYRWAGPPIVPSAEPKSRPAPLAPSSSVPNRHGHDRDRDRISATPRARRRAQELGIDLASIQGSGRGGRIREQDVVAAPPVVQEGHSRAATFMTARAPAEALDALVAEVVAHKPGYSREDLLVRLLISALRTYPGLNAGEQIEIGETFGFSDFTGRHIERWTPEIPDGSIAALGVGRASGNPLEYPLNLSFDSSQISPAKAADFLDFVCELIESPMLGLVR